MPKNSTNLANVSGTVAISISPSYYPAPSNKRPASMVNTGNVKRSCLLEPPSVVSTLSQGNQGKSISQLWATLSSATNLLGTLVESLTLPPPLKVQSHMTQMTIADLTDTTTWSHTSTNLSLPQPMTGHDPQPMTGHNPDPHFCQPLS
jgi:hypothetical protein